MGEFDPSRTGKFRLSDIERAAGAGRVKKRRECAPDVGGCIVAVLSILVFIAGAIALLRDLER